MLYGCSVLKVYFFNSILINRIMNRLIGRILWLLVLMSAVMPAYAINASQVLDRAASSLAKSKGVTAAYTLVSGSARQSGSIKSKGKKFVITAGGVTTWYDGHTQWNLNAASGEVTVSTPTAQELASGNPYLLVTSYKTHYTLKPLKSKIPGTYAIQLSPKSAQNPVKQAVIYIRSSDYMPCRLDVTPRKGSVTSVMITSIKKGVSLADSDFVFPKSRYPKVEVIDLR